MDTLHQPMHKVRSWKNKSGSCPAESTYLFRLLMPTLALKYGARRSVYMGWTE